MFEEPHTHGSFLFQMRIFWKHQGNSDMRQNSTEHVVNQLNPLDPIQELPLACYHVDLTAIWLHVTFWMRAQYA